MSTSASEYSNHIQAWINKGTYICPMCLHRMSGTAWSMLSGSHRCPQCHDANVQDFRREHK